MPELIPLLFIAALRAGRIFKPPKCRNRMAWPYRTRFTGGSVAQSDNEVHFRCIGPAKFITGLAAKSVGGESVSAHQFDSERTYFTGRVTSRAVCPESTAAQFIQHCFCHYATRGVPRIEEENIIGS